MARFKPPRTAIPVFLGLFAFFAPFSIAGAHISLALATLTMVLDPDARRATSRWARSHPIVLPLAAWCLVSVLAVVFAVDPGRSFEKLKKLALLPLLPLGALPEVRRALRPILSVLIAATAIVAIYGLFWHWSRGGGLEARIEGISGFYMTVAGTLMIVGLLCLAEFVSATKDPRSRRILFLAISGVVILGALLGTYTRGSWIGFVAGAVFVLRRHRTALASLAVVVGLFYFLGPAEMRDRLHSIVDPSHPRNAERLLIWQHGLDMIGDRPWTGAGLVIPQELMEREVVTETGVIRVHSHMHNTFLQIAVSMGIPALGVFLWTIVAFFRMGRRAMRNPIRNLWEEGLVAAYPAVLIALLVNGLFEWNFGDSEILGLFYFVTGLTLGIDVGVDD
jgi:O-antigen ligase